MKQASIIKVTDKRMFFLWLGTLPITLSLKQAELAWNMYKHATKVMWIKGEGIIDILRDGSSGSSGVS